MIFLLEHSTGYLPRRGKTQRSAYNNYATRPTLRLVFMTNLTRTVIARNQILSHKECTGQPISIINLPTIPHRLIPPQDLNPKNGIKPRLWRWQPSWCPDDTFNHCRRRCVWSKVLLFLILNTRRWKRTKNMNENLKAKQFHMQLQRSCLQHSLYVFLQMFWQKGAAVDRYFEHKYFEHLDK